MTERTEKIIAMRTNGSSYAEIARETTCSNNTVYQTLVRAGLIKKGSKSGLTDEQKQEIVQLRTDDRKQWTYMALSMKFNVQPPTINKVLRAAGLVKVK